MDRTKKIKMELTILIPTYNRKKLLDVTLKHLIGRLNKFPKFEFEIIVSDNASIESPEDVIDNLRNPRISYIENQKNIGISRNILNAAKLAKGKYLWIFGDDDLVDSKVMYSIVNLIKAGEDFGILQIARKNFIKEEDINWCLKEVNIDSHKMQLTKNLEKIDSGFGFISSNILLREKFNLVTKKIVSRDVSLIDNNYLVKLINYEIYKISKNNLIINDELIYQRVTEASSFYKTPELIFKTFFKDVSDIIHYHKIYNPEFLFTKKIYYKRNLDILIIRMFHPSSFIRLLNIFSYTGSVYIKFYVLFLLLTPKFLVRKLYLFHKKLKGQEVPFIFKIND